MGDQGAPAHVVVAVTDQVGRIRLNRPEKRNALTNAMLTQLLEAFDRFERSADVRVLLLSGTGRAFCSGVDLADMQATRERHGSFDYELLPQVFDCLGKFSKPSVAMVQGAAIAGGCELALHCDLRIGSPAAKFAMPLARLGLVIPCEPAERLVNIVGVGPARDMLLTGDGIEGARAERIGLLSRLVADDELVAETEALVQRLACNAPLSVVAMKRMLNHFGSVLTDPDRRHFESERIRISQSEDMREGLQAFFERRPPKFRGL